MHVLLRGTEDRDRLQQRVNDERDAEQRDRYRAALLAIGNEHETQTIAKMLDRSRRFVQRWAYAYRDGGIEALVPAPRPGAASKLQRQQEQQFIQRLKGGPTEADAGVCSLRGKDAVRILEQEFGVKYSLGGAYDLLHRLGFSCLRPRPRHRKNDPQAMQQWLDQAPLLSSVCKSSTRARPSKSGSRTKRGLDNKGP